MARRSTKATATPTNVLSQYSTPRSGFSVTSFHSPASPYNDPFNDMGQHDRRQFNPTSAYSGPAATPIRAVKQKVSGKYLSPFTAFAQPKHVAICLRRKMRRRVLMALKVNKSRAGRGKKSRNQWSNVRC